MQFKIESAAGVILGTYDAPDKDGALDALARDAGYTDHASIPDEARDDDLIVAQIEEIRQ